MRYSSSSGLLVTLYLLVVVRTAQLCESGGWVNLTSLPQPLQEHGTVAVGNTTIAVLGGIISNGNNTETTNIVQLYDIDSGLWITVSPAPYKVNHPNVAALENKIYLLGGLAPSPVVGGSSINWVASKECHVYDIATDRWADLPSMPNGTERGSAVVGVHKEMIYLAGGMTVLQSDYQDAVDSVIAFNTSSEKWQRLVAAAAELPESRQHAAGTVVADTLYVVGGRRYSQLGTRDTVFELDLLDQENGWRTSTGHMPVARGGLSGGAVGSKFYAFGGEGNPDSSTGLFNETEVYDTRSQEWTELKSMAVPRHGTQAAASGGRIYIPGGGLQQGGKEFVINGVTETQNPTSHFDAYCA